jgi:hypothetical protein
MSALRGVERIRCVELMAAMGVNKRDMDSL